MTTILFQGDSITDACRSRENDALLGSGYPFFVNAELSASNPGEYRCLNRGISGNRIVDVYARIKTDIINLKPDVMSMLIGVNDVWHELSFQNGISAEKFEKLYNMLIEEVLAELPNLKIIIMEPFVMPGEATDPNMDYFKEQVPLMGAAAKRIAEKYGFPFIPLQSIFDEACKKAPAWNWTPDGVHPSTAGHVLIKNEWLKAFATL